MKIETSREGNFTLLHLEGRLDRERAEHLSVTIEQLLQRGARSLRIDLAEVSYMSSAATRVFNRWQQELALLRGELQLTAMSPAVADGLAVTGWNPAGAGQRRSDPQHSYWHARADLADSGSYEVSEIAPGRTLQCRLHGIPERLALASYQSADCATVSFPSASFGLGLGAIGSGYHECHAHFGELIAASGCIAAFPGDGARMADYLTGSPDGRVPQAVLASGFCCEGEFSHLIRFGPQPEVSAVSLSELIRVALEAAGGRVAGMVMVGEAAGLSGVRLRRSPSDHSSPVRFALPAVREWMLFSPERTHHMTTAVIAGIVARTPDAILSPHLRPLGESKLYGHFHAAVFGYHALPQRTVDLGVLLRMLFTNEPLRDVLHLLWDDRTDGGVPETELIRGVTWTAPIAHPA